MARAGLLDVPRDEPRQAETRRALRLDLEPQFRGPPGIQGPHAPGLANNGGGGSDRRAFCRHQGVAIAFLASTSSHCRSDSLSSWEQTGRLTKARRFARSELWPISLNSSI